MHPIEKVEWYLRELDLSIGDLRGKILDVGAGSCLFAAGCEMLNVPAIVYSLEPRREHTIHSWAELPSEYFGSWQQNVVWGSAPNLPFPDASFDLIVAAGGVPAIFGDDFSSILATPESFLRVLRKGGEARMMPVGFEPEFLRARAALPSQKESFEKQLAEDIAYQETLRRAVECTKGKASFEWRHPRWRCPMTKQIFTFPVLRLVKTT